jgi:hypothetical protein
MWLEEGNYPNKSSWQQQSRCAALKARQILLFYQYAILMSAF